MQGADKTQQVTVDTSTPLDVAISSAPTLDVAIESAPTLSTRIVGGAAYGETAPQSVSSVLSISGAYGLQSDVVEQLTATGGSISIGSGRVISLQSGTSVGGYAVARSYRNLRWRPGETQSFTCCASFPTGGVNLGAQRIGTASQSSAYAIGYNNADFGWITQSAGGGEIRTLTVSVGAGGSETATVTLNTVAYTVSLTSGSTTATAAQIAAGTGWASLWDSFQIGATVIFRARNSGVVSGTFTLTSTGTAAGTFAQTFAGSANVASVVTQANWNKDTCLGEGGSTNPSGFALDPTKLNVYRCVYTWEHFDAYVFVPSLARFVHVHTQTALNTATTPQVVDPTMQIGAVCASLGSTTAQTVNVLWINGEAASDTAPVRNPRSAASQKTGLTTGGERPLLAIRNGPILAGVLNQFQILPTRITVFNGAAKDAVVYLRYNATLTGAQWASIDANTPVNVDTTSTAIANGTSLDTFIVAAGTSASIDTSGLRILLDREELLSVSISVASGAAYDASASISWQGRA